MHHALDVCCWAAPLLHSAVHVRRAWLGVSSLVSHNPRASPPVCVHILLKSCGAKLCDKELPTGVWFFTEPRILHAEDIPVVVVSWPPAAMPFAMKPSNRIGFSSARAAPDRKNLRS